jgi:hypothetical protein
MVDVRGLPAGDLSADDFVLRVGTSGDIRSWAPADAIPQVAVRRGAGAGGSDRVTLTWPDGTIRNTWLEVTVLANTRTGLSTPNVFYFGSLVGNTDPRRAPFQFSTRVDAADLFRVRAARGAAAGIESAADINRDGAVNVLDEQLVRANRGREMPWMSIPMPPPYESMSAATKHRRRTTYGVA